MDPIDSSSRNIANNSFGDNVTIYQGNIQNPAADHRNQCLKDLRLTDPRDDKIRIQQTNGGLLKEASNWIFENEIFKQWRDDKQNTLLWIKGDPGKGKTMLLCAIIDELVPKTKLLKPIDRTTETFLFYFFCQGTDSRINNATAVLRGLIYLIIIQEPLLISHVQEKYNHAGKGLFLDANAWVTLSQMLQSILHDSKVADIVLVVDALDECETDSFQLLDFITQHTSLSHVKWILSSRNTLNIQQRLEPFIQSGILSLELKANAETVSNAVDIYIEHRISRLRPVQHNQSQRNEIRKFLREKANGTFLWVSLVMKELEDVQSWEVTEVVKEMPMDLSAIYRRMISHIGRQRRRTAEFCWKILWTISTAYYPISLGELGIISGLPKEISEHVESIIKLVVMCGSFLTIRQGMIYFIHQSAKDFLSTEAVLFQLHASQIHADIFEQSITAISTLPQNIYGLPNSGFRAKSAPPPNPNPLASMRYACFCWTGHFCDAYGANPLPELELELKEKLLSFLQNYVLRWLESIILLGRLPDALRSIQRILRELRFDTDSHLSNFLHSTEKFIINNGSIIDRAPLQVYGSALVFSQTLSYIKQYQWKARLPLIEDIQGSIRTNRALLQTLEGHNFAVKAVCFSPDGKTIASCCVNQTIRVWDAATGATQHTLMTGGRSILAVSFSPDSKLLMFVFTRGYNTVGPHLNLVAVSLDDKTPSTQPYSSTIRLNGRAANECSQELKRRHGEKTLPVLATFSLDGKTIATSESHGPIELWSATKCVPLRVFQKFKKGVADFSAIAFSPDSKTIASGHGHGIVNLWHVETGACFQTFKTPYPLIFAIAFTIDGKKVALGLSYPHNQMCALDMATGGDERTHIDHDDHKIYTIAFSPDSKTVASGSDDSTIRLWDADSVMRPWTTEDELDPSSRQGISKMAFSPDGTTLASFNDKNGEIQIWDTSKGTYQTIFDVPIELDPTGPVGDGAITVSHNGRTLALGYNGIWLWDIAAGRLVHYPYPSPFTSHLCTCSAIAFSPNGEELALNIGANEIPLLNTTTGKVSKILEHQGQSVSAISFSPGSKTLMAAYDSGIISEWDTDTGALLRQFTSPYLGGVRYTSIKYLADEPFLWVNYRYIMNISTQDVKLPQVKLPEQHLICIDEEWINEDGMFLLWLPREYRSNEIAVQGNVVAIGHKSGILFLRFKSTAAEKSKQIKQPEDVWISTGNGEGASVR